MNPAPARRTRSAPICQRRRARLRLVCFIANAHPFAKPGHSLCRGSPVSPARCLEVLRSPCRSIRPSYPNRQQKGQSLRRAKECSPARHINYDCLGERNVKTALGRDCFRVGGEMSLGRSPRAYTGSTLAARLIWCENSNYLGPSASPYCCASTAIEYARSQRNVHVLVQEFNRTQRRSCVRERIELLRRRTIAIKVARQPKERESRNSRALRVSPLEKRRIEGTGGLVSATVSPIAVYAGIQALELGGTAADAAATTALTQIATQLGSVVSYAGVFTMVYYDAKTRKVYSMDAGYNSYLSETDPKSIPVSDLGPVLVKFVPKPTEGGAKGRETLVPGFMAGVEAMHGRFGRLPFRELFEPAVWYAERGIRISPALQYYFTFRAKALARTA